MAKPHLIRYGKDNAAYRDLTGQRFGILTALRAVPKEESRTRDFKWECLCDCGGMVTLGGCYLRSYEKKGIKTPPNCGCLKSGKTAPTYRGYEEITGVFLWTLKDQADKRSLECSVTPEYIWNLFLVQERKCKLSGIPLRFKLTDADEAGTASLDRIDSSKGYVPGNVQWIHKDINIMKSNFIDSHFINLCKAVASYNEGGVPLGSLVCERQIRHKESDKAIEQIRAILVREGIM